MRASGLRLVTLCGDAGPSFSGIGDFESCLLNTLQSRGVTSCPIDLGSWTIAQTPQLLSAVAAARPDIVLMQYPTAAFGQQLGPHTFSLLQRIAPLVVTLHEFTTAHVLRRISLAPLLARAAAVVVAAEREAKSLGRWFPWLSGERIKVIEIGANMPERTWTPAAAPNVIYFGQIRPNKGLEDFLACYDRLTSQGLQARFTIIGARVAKFAAFYDRIVSETRARDVEFLPGLNREEVSDRLAQAWVALLPFPDGASFRRGSLLASAVCGVPIVTRLGPDTPPVLETLLNPLTTVTELAARVRQMLEEAELRRVAHERSCTLAGMVGWGAIADNYLQMFDHVVMRDRLSTD